MIAEGQDGSVISLVEGGLLRGSEDGERATTSLSVGSLESGGTEDVHEELKETEEKSDRYIYPTKRLTPDSGTTGDS
jgi:hypothetical protein